MSRIVVTGGAGFIGSHIAERLLSDGHEVISVDNYDPYYDPLLKRENTALLQRYPDFRFVEGSILDRGLVDDIMKGGVDYVYHEAAQAGVRISVEDPFKPLEVNARGTLILLEACKKHGVRKFINASSSSVYGTVRYMPFDEVHPLIPVSPYGGTKVLAEHYCRIYHELHGIDYVSLRYFTVFGERMRPDLAITIFTQKALKNEPITIFGDGKKTRDFTYISNIVEGNIKIMERGAGEYNFGCCKSASIQELAEKIIRITDSRSEIEYTEAVKGDAMHTLASIDKAKNEIGYEPEISLDEGLERYVEWHRENRLDKLKI